MSPPVLDAPPAGGVVCQRTEARAGDDGRPVNPGARPRRNASPITAVRGALGRLLRRLAHAPGRLACPVCGARVRAFEPIEPELGLHHQQAGFAHGLGDFETLNAAEYRCPVCREPDRSRLYALYLRDRLDRGASPLVFLDLAPSPMLARNIRSHAGLRYVSMDIGMPGVDVRASLTNLPLATGAVDAFLCSHVLEHIREEGRALAELFRVLRPGGWGIVMVPIVLTLSGTVELPEGASEADGWRLVGQGDHVRLHQRSDFVARLRGAGFSVSELGVETFGAESFRRHGIASRSVLYVVGKQESARA